MFFSGIGSVIKVIVLTSLIYLTVVFVVRVSGKRSLGSLNAFDLLLTISMGSIVSSTILSKDTAYVEGMSSILTIIAFQYILTKLSTVSRKVKNIVRSTPTLLYFKGEYLEENMKKMRITKSDILQQARLEKGATSDKIKAVVLESNGKLSVITHLDDEGEKELEQYL